MDEEDTYEDDVFYKETGFPKWMKPPMPPAPSSDFYMNRLDGTNLLNQIELQLRGQIVDSNGKPIKKWKAECNEDGIGMILSCIYTFGLNQNVFLGNLTDEEIKTRCRETWKNLAVLFALKYEVYAIPKENRKILLKKIVYTMHSGLSRSQFGKEASEISSATIRQENVNITPEQKHKSLLNPTSWFGKDK